MKEKFQRYFEQFINVLVRYWVKLKQVNYIYMLKLLGTGLVALPGTAAWVLEVIVLSVAISFVCMAGSKAYEDELWSAALLIALSVLLVVLAIITDYYTRPNKEENPP